MITFSLEEAGVCVWVLLFFPFSRLTIIILVPPYIYFLTANSKFG